MRLTISLDDDLYSLVKGLARSEDLSMSQIVNRLLRRVVEGSPAPIEVPHVSAPWPTIEVRPGVIIRGDEARQLEEEEDNAQARKAELPR